MVQIRVRENHEIQHNASPPTGGYPIEPLIPVEHVSGTAIYVEVVVGEERLKNGNIGLPKRTSKSGDGGSDFMFRRRLLGFRWSGRTQ